MKIQHVEVPIGLLKDKELTDGEKIVLELILSYSLDPKISKIQISDTKMAEMIGKERRSAIRMRQGLESKGYIKTYSSKTENNYNEATTYYLQRDKIKEKYGVGVFSNMKGDNKPIPTKKEEEPDGLDF